MVQGGINLFLQNEDFSLDKIRVGTLFTINISNGAEIDLIIVHDSLDRKPAKKLSWTMIAHKIPLP